MISVCVKMNLVLVFLFYFSIIVSAVAPEPNTFITISLNKTYTYKNKEIYGEFINMTNSSTIKVNFTDIPVDTNLTFFVIQAHSFINSINMYQNIKKNGCQINGTNIGMVSLLNTDVGLPPTMKDVYYFENMNKINVLIYLSVHVYEKNPYPGGCNIEFQVEIAPYMIVNTKKDLITIDAAPPSFSPNCDDTENNLTSFYMMYLPEMHYDEKEYFIGLKKMMTLEKIHEYGTLIPQTSLEMRRTLSAYPGTGVIVVAVASYDGEDTGNYSIYVPNHSYGCPEFDEDGCKMYRSVFVELMCICLLIAGLFITFFGHRYFRTEMFLSGVFSGFIMTYIFINLLDIKDAADDAVISASAITGVCLGGIWLLFWWLYGIPVLAMLLPSLNIGFLMASVFYYRTPAISYLKDDLNFWSLFCLLMLLTALALVSMTYSASILSCSVLGSFAAMYAVDYAFGSNLKYILINTIRRAVVPKFKYAVLAPPFQWRDVAMTLLWVTLACLGWTYQHWHNRGRPPFPPPPRSTREVIPHTTATGYGTVTNNASRIQKYFIGPRGTTTERTPLMSED